MPSETEKINFTPMELPEVRRSPWGVLKIALLLVLIGGAVAAWRMGYLPSLMARQTGPVFRLVEVDRGDINISVVETGTVESSNNATIRCHVEAILGTVGGSQSTGTGKAGGTAAGAQAGSTAGGSTSGGAGAAGGAGGAQQSTAKAKTTKKAGASGSTGASTSSGSGTGAASGSGGASGGSTTASASTGATTTSSKPVIRSFSLAVTPYVPLRPAMTKAVDTTAQKKASGGQGGMGGGGGGGRGGGGGGGRGGGGGGGGRRGMMQIDESPGSTSIVYLIAEGTQIKAGELLCKLDSAAYEDEEQAQLIRYHQAETYVVQSASSLEVAKISLREYRDGIYPQDIQLVKQYIEACELDRDRLGRTAIWSRDMLKKGYRTGNQVKGDQKAFEQAEIALGEARNMLERLLNQTGPKILKSLEANVKAIEADNLMQDAAFNLEKQRLARIRKNIKNCTLYAPTDGIVVYVNQSNQFGMVTVPIAEGVTVRQDQPIINLPDPLHMRVKARINESKLSFIQSGQVARIVIDAFRDRPLKGRVSEVTAINTPLNASDVRVYYAKVDIAEGFADLRPGLSAEVVFLVDSRRDVTRVPLDAIRWVNERGYVALYDPSSTNAQQKWRWKEVHLGISDWQYAEVVSGLEPGDRIVATPRELPAPAPASTSEAAATTVAEATP